MSIQPNASLTYIGLAAPASSLVGIILNIVFYIWMNRKKLLNTNQNITKEWQKFNEGRNTMKTIYDRSSTGTLTLKIELSVVRLLRQEPLKMGKILLPAHRRP